jgi:hypothetical protein
MTKKCPLTSSSLNSRLKVQTVSSYFVFFARYYKRDQIKEDPMDMQGIGKKPLRSFGLKTLKERNRLEYFRRDQRIILKLTRSWSWALLEKPPIVQPLRNFPAFYGTRTFITVFTRAFHWSLSWARSIQSIPPPSYLCKIHLNIIHPSSSCSSQKKDLRKLEYECVDSLWYKTGTSGGLLWARWWIFGFHRIRGNFETDGPL